MDGIKYTAAMRKLMAQLGRRGGKARAASLSPERRSEIAKGAVAARERGKVERGEK